MFNLKRYSHGKKIISNPIFYTINIILGGVLGSYCGTQFLLKLAVTEDNEKYWINFENFNQIYKVLEKTNKPIFLVYYTPFERYWFPLRKTIFEYIDIHKKDLKVNFCLVNKRIHYDSLRNIDFENNIYSELILPNKFKENDETLEFERIKFDRANHIFGLSSFINFHTENKFKLINNFWDKKLN